MAEELAEFCRRMQLSNKEKLCINLRNDPIVKSKEAQFSILFMVVFQERDDLERIFVQSP